MSYYAVVTGREPGIYTTWPECQKQIFKFKNAAYAKFSTKSEAEKFMSHKTKCAGPKYDPGMVSDMDPVIIYTDGSFAKGKMGYGIVVLGKYDIFKDEVNEIYGAVPSRIDGFGLGNSNNVAELFAIYQALKIVKGDVIIRTDSSYAVGALSFHIHTWKDRGWNGIANRNLIEAIDNITTKRSVVYEHVDGHSTSEYNQLADRLANLGRNN